jgi:hypothetical protein
MRCRRLMSIAASKAHDMTWVRHAKAPHQSRRKDKDQRRTDLVCGYTITGAVERMSQGPASPAAGPLGQGDKGQRRGGGRVGGGPLGKWMGERGRTVGELQTKGWLYGGGDRDRQVLCIPSGLYGEGRLGLVPQRRGPGWSPSQLTGTSQELVEGLRAQTSHAGGPEKKGEAWTFGDAPHYHNQGPKFEPG